MNVALGRPRRRTNYFFWEMASRDPSRVTAIPSELSRGSSQGAKVWSRIINTANNTVLWRERDIKADLSDADKCSAFFAGTIEYAVFPHARCPQFAASLGIRNRTLAWQRVVKDIKANVGGGGRMLADCLGEIAIVFARAFAALGSYCFLLYITPDKAEE